MQDMLPRRRPLFTSLWSYLPAFAVGFAACVVGSGLLRHFGNPVRYPLVENGRPVWSTFDIDPDGNPYAALFKWRAQVTGDFRPIFAAAKELRDDPHARIYHPEELKQNLASFVYTPFTAMAASPLVRPGVSRFAVANWVSAVNHAMWVAGGALLILIALRGRPITPAWVALLVLHYVLYYPMAKALQLTQASVWIFFFLTLSAFWLQRRRHVLAGAALAVGVSIKPHLAVVLIAMSLARGFPLRMIISCLVGLALTTAASVWYAGWDNCVDYVTRVLPILSAGYAYYPNQSLNGLLHRMFTSTDPRAFNLAPNIAWIKTVCAAYGIAVQAVAVIVLRQARTPRSDERLVLAYATLLVAATAASPVCWLHHFTVLLIAFAAAVGLCLRHPVLRSRGVDAALFASFLLTGCFFDTRWLGNGAVALLGGLGFFGMLMLLVVLLVLSRRLAMLPREADAATT